MLWLVNPCPNQRAVTGTQSFSVSEVGSSKLHCGYPGSQGIPRQIVSPVWHEPGFLAAITMRSPVEFYVSSGRRDRTQGRLQFGHSNKTGNGPKDS